MKTNSEILDQALAALKGKWGLAVGTFLVILILSGFEFSIRYFVTSGVSLGISLLGIIIKAPLQLGAALFSLNVARDREAKFEDIFYGFSRFFEAFLAYLLYFIFILLWTLLLIVPGIIAAISYSQTFFIMADDESIGPNAAIDKSKAMMQGHKMQYFTLSLRFLGLGIVCLFTLGIGFLWLIPFMQVSLAKFYEELKNAEHMA